MAARTPSTLDDGLWAPVADLMAVIMLVFMLIVMVLFFGYSIEKQSNIEKCEKTRESLEKEFAKDFEKWGAKLQEDLTILFTTERVLFEKASDKIEDGGWFANRLDNFFPRYMEVIVDEVGADDVLQIRIDGHASRDYGEHHPDSDIAYTGNMRLSQNRAISILEHVLPRLKERRHNDLAREKITASGWSSSQSVESNGEEDENASRRVEFKLLTKSCQKAGLYDGQSSAI